MKNLTIILLTFLLMTSLYADEIDPFKDMGSYEFDPNFEDDFSIIEQSPLRAAENSLTDSFLPFSSRGIVRDERSLGSFLGQETIARIFYLSVIPKAHFKFLNIDTHLKVPLRFPVYDNIEKNKAGIRGHGFVNAEQFITPRPQDFRDFSDIQRIIQRISFSDKNNAYSLLLDREHAFSLGHGDLMREMTSLGLYDQDYLFLSGHAAIDPVSIDAVFGPLPLVSLIGINTRFLPLATFDLHPFVKNAFMDIQYVADYRAPNEAMMEEGAYVLNDERRLIKRNESAVNGLSLALASEVFPVAFLGSKPYVSYSHLFLSGLSKNEEEPWRYGASLNLGHNATIYPVINDNRHKLFFNAEGRLFSQNYQPNYFGGHYMLDRITFNEVGPIKTKSEYVGFEKNSSLRLGHLLELGYVFGDNFNIKIGYENARTLNDKKSIAPLRKVHFNTSLCALDDLRFQLGYEALSIAHIGDLFDFEKSRALLSVRGQIKLLPFLYFDTWLKHSFGIHEKYRVAAKNDGLRAVWLSNLGETRSLNFGLGLELAMVF